MKWISAEECQELIAAENVNIIDVRESWEYEICHIGSVHIPMAEIAGHVESLDKTGAYLIVCKTGRRAEAVANLLETDYGFSNLSVLEGGITAWYALTEPDFELY